MLRRALILSFIAFVRLQAMAISSDNNPDYEVVESVISPDTLIPTDTISYRMREFSDDDVKVLEELINQYEKQNKVKEVIRSYEDNILKKEMSFDWLSTIPLIRGGILTASTDKFKSRDALFEYHHSKKWEYATASIPLLSAWSLKAAGVESRSKLQRMATANGIGLAVGVGVTELLKATTNELRPNGHDEHSLASGHSALAFFSAAVLDREYGHYSPWVSVGGYAVAVATQLQRIHNNHHYINDVVTGAGVGIVSANFGYFIADRIFGAKGINQPHLSMGDILTFSKFVAHPSSISLLSGMETGYNRIENNCFDSFDESKNLSFRTTTGFSTALELSLFLNSHWAIEAMARASQFKVQAFNNGDDDITIFGNNLYQYHFDLGSKYSLLITPERRVNFRAFAGERFSPAVDFHTLQGDRVARVNTTNDFEFGGGISFDMLSTSKYLSGFSCDYTHVCSHLLKNRWNIASYWKILF